MNFMNVKIQLASFTCLQTFKIIFNQTKNIMKKLAIAISQTILGKKKHIETKLKIFMLHK